MTTTQNTFNLHQQYQAPQSQIHLPVAIGSQSYLVRQGHVTPPLNIPATAATYNPGSPNHNTTTHVPEVDSKPKATLHQGDDPPDYEEAIGMTSIA